MILFGQAGMEQWEEQVLWWFFLWKLFGLPPFFPFFPIIIIIIIRWVLEPVVVPSIPIITQFLSTSI